MYFHTNSVGYYVDSIPEFVVIMQRNVLIYSILGMIHTINGFIGEDDCSNDPCMIVRVSFFSSLILPFLSIILYVIIDLQTYYIYRPTSPRILFASGPCISFASGSCLLLLSSNCQSSKTVWSSSRRVRVDLRAGRTYIESHHDRSYHRICW